METDFLLSFIIFMNIFGIFGMNILIKCFKVLNPLMKSFAIPCYPLTMVLPINASENISHKLRFLLFYSCVFYET